MSDLRDALRGLGLDVRGDAASWAALSPCGRYRYALGRSWGGLFRGTTMTWCLHNPSRADDTVTDPTLGKCIHFARRENCEGIVLVNLMAFRATNKADIDPTDPEGPLNEAVRRLAFAEPGPLVVAWGRLHKDHARRADAIPRLDRLLCLGTNNDGSPVHPLYKANDTPLVRWP